MVSNKRHRLLDFDYSIDAHIPNADCSENKIACKVFGAPREKSLSDVVYPVQWFSGHHSDELNR